MSSRTDWISESWTEPGKVADLRAAYAGWHPQVQRIIDAVDETFIWAVLDRKPIERWTYGRITMLGDACHPMMPFMGQGGAQAIEDAAAITACLLRCGDDVEAGLKLYETGAAAARLADPGRLMGRTRPGSTCPTARPGRARRTDGQRHDRLVLRSAIAWVYGHDAGRLEDAA